MRLNRELVMPLRRPDDVRTERVHRFICVVAGRHSVIHGPSIRF
ncbi:hypothetical protein MPS_0357 [Mycobacterium pseudoshottsii JCM 15466]|nr:hypothetical protein MMSP_3834 [Mycobacterium sp. 012931]EPQ79961.1 hypothetical protein MMEU_0485 [Mycobacterium marinum str. Europe]GAQ31977.1 hypothetical protein MPS_0357 [Mycobacterium pseudoshottsii JCM 15466]